MDSKVARPEGLDGGKEWADTHQGPVIPSFQETLGKNPKVWGSGVYFPGFSEKSQKNLGEKPWENIPGKINLCLFSQCLNLCFFGNLGMTDP